MNKISCALVEDDILSLTIVERLVERTGLLEIMGKFGSPEKALHWLMNNEVDLLFLDVEMPGITGLEIIRSLSYRPDVIIISAKSDYAAEAYDLSVIDYLVKPIKDYSRFLSAINKVIVKRRLHGQGRDDESLFVKVDSLLLQVDLGAVLWVEAFGDYIKIHTEDKTHTIYSTLKKLEDKLDKTKFARVHRSYIVNISKITNIDPHNLEINKTIIPISETYKVELLNKIRVL
jgi:two-component system LytT family response regulator